MSYPCPEDEQDRLETLRRYRILDTAPEEPFDQLTELGKKLLDADHVALAFLGEHRKWIKSRAGFDIDDVSRDVSFCTHTILDDDIFIVSDATEDDRFQNHPCVTDPPHVRFYAGVPLIVDSGHRLGTFYMMDTEPRELPDEKRRILNLLRDQSSFLLEERLQELKLSEELSLTKATIDSTQVGLLVFNQEGRIVNHNQKFLDLWDISEETLTSNEPRPVIDQLADQLEEPSVIYDDFRRIQNHFPREKQIQVECTDERSFKWESRPRHDAGSYRGQIWAFQDLTEKKKKEQQIQFLAHHDKLTGLPDLHRFTELFEEKLHHARNNSEALAFLKLDISNTKRINEILGQEAGDQMIKTIADRLTDLMEDLTIGRLIGDQFGILIQRPNEKEELPSELAERVLECIHQPMEIQNSSFQVPGKIGISLYPIHGDTVDDLMQRAQAALASTTQEEGNRIRLYFPKMATAERHELQLEQDLREALRNDELDLYHQPLLTMQDDGVTGLEALVRWHHPHQGYIPPPVIIDIAQTIGQISRLGRWVLKKACERTAEWNQNRSRPLNISVNVSAVEFMQKEKYLDSLNQVLEETALAPEHLVLELTETEIMEDVSYSKVIMKHLKDIGVSIAIDDFGTGYSSLQYLSEFPIDILKIDRHFIQNLTEGNVNENLVRAIINMASSLDLSVIAEGVETEEQLETLQELKCEMYQGYIHSKPVAPDQLEPYL